MEEDDEIVEKVNKANTQFYRAFENFHVITELLPDFTRA
jgi:hypothetical protein